MSCYKFLIKIKGQTLIPNCKQTPYQSAKQWYLKQTCTHIFIKPLSIHRRLMWNQQMTTFVSVCLNKFRSWCWKLQSIFNYLETEVAQIASWCLDHWWILTKFQTIFENKKAHFWLSVANSLTSKTWFNWQCISILNL